MKKKKLIKLKDIISHGYLIVTILNNLDTTPKFGFHEIKYYKT
jgi:hypothetical protein